MVSGIDDLEAEVSRIDDELDALNDHSLECTTLLTNKVNELYSRLDTLAIAFVVAVVLLAGSVLLLFLKP